MSRKKTIIGLDIGSSAAKVAIMSIQRGQLVLKGLELIPLVSDRHEDRWRVIQDRLAPLKLKRCVVGVSGRSVCVRYLPVTAGSPAALKQALAFEADNVIPFELNEVYLDGQNITPFEGLSDQAEIDAILVAAKKDRVDEMIKDVRGVGLVPQVIDVEAFALGNLFELQGQDQSLPVALIDVGAFKTSINIVKSGTSRFSREVYLGGNDFRQVLVDKLGVSLEQADRLLTGEDQHEDTDHLVETVMAEMSSELLLAIEFFEGRSPEAVVDVRVTGGAAGTPGLLGHLSQTFGREISLWNPFENLTCDGCDPDDLGTDRYRFAVAVGLSTRIGDVA